MKKKWKDANINLGILRPYQEERVIFESEDSLKDAVTVTSSCGCSRGEIVGDVVRVTFKTGDFPRHLSKMGSKTYNFKKHIKVYYNDGEYDLLEFYGVVQR